MTTAHVEKFVELVGKDPALSAKLDAATTAASAAAFISILAYDEKFVELVRKDPALSAKLDAAAAAAGAAAYIANAVKIAKRLGLEFTEEEAQAFMSAESETAASGELSDTQLEAVAGGIGLRGRPLPRLSAFGQAMKTQIGSAQAVRNASISRTGFRG